MLILLILMILLVLLILLILLILNKCENYNQWSSTQKCSELTINNENKRVRKLHTLVSKTCIEMNATKNDKNHQMYDS